MDLTNELANHSNHSIFISDVYKVLGSENVFNIACKGHNCHKFVIDVHRQLRYTVKQLTDEVRCLVNQRSVDPLIS